MVPYYHYKVKITRVSDGDTYIGTVDLGFGTYKTERFRLAEVDTPETYRPSSESERTHGQQATDFVKNRILDKEVIMHSVKKDKYGRYLAYIYLSEEDFHNGVDLGSMLIENNLIKLESYVD